MMSMVPGYPVCKPASIKWMGSLAEASTGSNLSYSFKFKERVVVCLSFFVLLPVLLPLYPPLLPMERWLSLMSGSAKERTVIKMWQLIRAVLKRNLLQGSKKHVGGCAPWLREWGSSLHLFALWLWRAKCRGSVPQGNSTAIWGAVTRLNRGWRIVLLTPVSTLKYANGEDFCFCEPFSTLWKKNYQTHLYPQFSSILKYTRLYLHSRSSIILFLNTSTRSVFT